MRLCNCCKKPCNDVVNSLSESVGTSLPSYAAPEDLITTISGSCTRWRIVIVSVLCAVMIFYGLNTFVSELLLPENVEFYCIEGNESAKTENPCFTSNGTKCRHFNFSRIYGYTMTEKWKLVCDNGIKAKISNTVFKCGIAVGFIIGGYLADTWGRKKALFLSIILQPCTGLLVSSSSSYSFFVGVRFINGMALAGTSIAAIILTCEISSNKWRTFDISLLCVSLAVGYMLLPFVWMILSNTVKHSLIISLPPILLVLFAGIVRESPNWLLCRNQTTQAEAVLASVAHFNGHKIPSSFRIRPTFILHNGTFLSVVLTICDRPWEKGPNLNGRFGSFSHGRSHIRISTTANMLYGSNLGVCSIICNPATRWIVLVLYLLWFLTSFTSSLTLIYIWNSNENSIEALISCGEVSIVASLMSLIMCHILKHKVIIALNSLLACGTVCATTIINSQKRLSKGRFIMLNLIAYAFFAISLCTIFNVTPRIFPTEMRGQSTGVAIAIAEFGFIFAQFVLLFVYSTLPSILATYCFCGILIALCCKVLHTVHNRELPDLIEDTANFKDNYKPTRYTTIRAASATVDETEVKLVDFERGTSSTGQFLIPFHSRKKSEHKT